MKSQIVLVTGTLLGFILLAACGTPALPPGSSLRKFDSDSWKSMLNSTTTVRQEMIGDLIANVLPGKSEAEVITLLGQAETPSETHPTDEMVFYLGPERGSYFGNIDSEWLIVHFDSNKRYQRFFIHID